MTQKHQLTDEVLAERYVAGDQRAFDLLLARHQQKIFSYIFFVVRDRDVANDIFQETFVKIIVHLQQRRYVASGKFQSWIMRIAHNAIMDWYRSQKSDHLVDANHENNLSNLTHQDLIDGNIESKKVKEQVLSDVKKMMNLLPPTQREVVYMRYYQELSFKEIAETTGVSINTSLGRMRYAVLNMRRMANEHGIALQID